MLRPNLWEVLGLVVMVAGWWWLTGLVWAHHLGNIGMFFSGVSYLWRTKDVLSGGLAPEESPFFSRLSMPVENVPSTGPWARHMWWALTFSLLATCASTYWQTPRRVSYRLVEARDDRPLTFSAGPRVPVPDGLDVVKAPDSSSVRSRHRGIVVAPEQERPADRATEFQPVEEQPPVVGEADVVAPAGTVGVPGPPFNLRTGPTLESAGATGSRPVPF